jgi:hypothetical protein
MQGRTALTVRAVAAPVAAEPTAAVTLKACRRLQFGQVLKIVGGTPEMGNWEPTAAPGALRCRADVERRQDGTACPGGAASCQRSPAHQHPHPRQPSVALLASRRQPPCPHPAVLSPSVALSHPLAPLPRSHELVGGGCVVCHAGRAGRAARVQGGGGQRRRNPRLGGRPQPHPAGAEGGRSAAEPSGGVPFSVAAEGLGLGQCGWGVPGAAAGSERGSQVEERQQGSSVFGRAHECARGP